jgi:hypothetical protein
LRHYSWAFPRLVGYGGFVELMPALIPLSGYLHNRKGRYSGVCLTGATNHPNYEGEALCLP